MKMHSSEFVIQFNKMNVLLALNNSDTISNELFELERAIRELWDKTNEFSEKRCCIDLASAISESIMKENLLMDFAIRAYEAHDLETAFYGFAKGAQANSIGAKNNLAYIIRRSEIEIGWTVEEKSRIVLELLSQGLKEREPFSIVNAALVLCLLLGEDSDWKTADEMFHFVPSNKVQQVYDWWANLEDEIEGWLVHFFLLKHQKIEESVYGTIDAMCTKLSKDIDRFPDWLKNNNVTIYNDDEIDIP